MQRFLYPVKPALADFMPEVNLNLSACFLLDRMSGNLTKALHPNISREGTLSPYVTTSKNSLDNHGTLAIDGGEYLGGYGFRV